MDSSNKRKVVFSSSGVASFRRFLEQEREFVKKELDKKISFQTVVWNAEMSLDDFVSVGNFFIQGCRESLNDAMPIMNSGDGNDISAILVVTDSAAPESCADRKTVGQMLILSNRVGGETKIYTRSCNVAADNVAWSRWQVLQGMTELGVCDSVDACTDNGIYCGTLAAENNAPMFVLVVINNYMVVGGSGMPKSISQLMYAVDVAGSVCMKYRSSVGGNEWGFWKNIISNDNPGSIDFAEIEKVLCENSDGLIQETQRATNAENIINGKIAQIDETLLRLMQKSFPLTVKISCTPSVAINEYTGKEKEFTFSWSCSVDGAGVAPTDIESVTIEYNSKKIVLPADTASYKIALSGTTTVAVTVKAQGMTASASTRVLFGHRWYSGVVAPDFAADESTLKTLLQQGVAGAKSAVITYSAFSLKKIVYAYAAEYGVLTGIVDANNINLLGNYDFFKTTLNGVEYNVYISTEEFSVSGNITYKFQ